MAFGDGAALLLLEAGEGARGTTCGGAAEVRVRARRARAARGVTKPSPKEDAGDQGEEHPAEREQQYGQRQTPTAWGPARPGGGHR